MIWSPAPIIVGGQANNRSGISTAPARRGDNERFVWARTPKSHIAAGEIDLAAKSVSSGIEEHDLSVRACRNGAVDLRRRNALHKGRHLPR